MYLPTQTTSYVMSMHHWLHSVLAGRLFEKIARSLYTKSLKRQPILSTDIAFNDAFIGYMLLLVVTRHN